VCAFSPVQKAGLSIFSVGKTFLRENTIKQRKQGISSNYPPRQTSGHTSRRLELKEGEKEEE
jgi:hypothetical protein